MEQCMGVEPPGHTQRIITSESLREGLEFKDIVCLLAKGQRAGAGGQIIQIHGWWQFRGSRGK